MARAKLTIKRAEDTQASALHALITANLTEGHLLPRSLEDVTAHAGRFSVVMRGRKIVGCAELAPLSTQVAEVRSLAVEQKERGNGVGTMLVEDLRQRAYTEGFEKLSAFTHAPSYFSEKGFSIVPHVWVQEKIFTDCVKCEHFRRCRQYAMVASTEMSISEPQHVISVDRLRHGYGAQARA